MEWCSLKQVHLPISLHNADGGERPFRVRIVRGGERSEPAQDFRRRCEGSQREANRALHRRDCMWLRMSCACVFVALTPSMCVVHVSGERVCFPTQPSASLPSQIHPPGCARRCSSLAEGTITRDSFDLFAIPLGSSLLTASSPSPPLFPGRTLPCSRGDTVPGGSCGSHLAYLNGRAAV